MAVVECKELGKGRVGFDNSAHAVRTKQKAASFLLMILRVCVSAVAE